MTRTDLPIRTGSVVRPIVAVDPNQRLRVVRVDSSMPVAWVKRWPMRDEAYATPIYVDELERWPGRST